MITVFTIVIASLMIIVISASIALSVRTIQRAQKAIDKELQVFKELIEEHAIQTY